MPPCLFLTVLPREIRDLIYYEYLFTDKGYVLDFEAGKLRMHSGAPIDLALSYTCRILAAEMRGLALRINTVTFSTVTSPALRARAGRFECILRHIRFQEQLLLYRIARSPEFDLKKLEASFPGASRLWPFVWWDLGRYGHRVLTCDPIPPRLTDPLGSVPSAYHMATRQATMAAAALVSRDSVPADPLNERMDGRISVLRLYDLYSDPKTAPAFLSFLETPWAIPTQEEMDMLIQQVGWDLVCHRLRAGDVGDAGDDSDASEASDPSHASHASDGENGSDHAGNDLEDATGDSGDLLPEEVLDPNPRLLSQLSGDFWIEAANNSHFRFSAAAAAIHFLSQMSPTTRRHLRRIILNEDAESSPFPQSHARGLIPFCLENPGLRIERRLSLWGNVFLRHGYGNAWFEFGPLYSFRRLDEVHSTIPECVPPLSELARLSPQWISDCLSFWLAEALVLCEAGMPINVFSLTLDAGPMRETTSHIFHDVVHRDAAWQRAIRTRFGPDGESDGLASSSWVQQNGALWASCRIYKCTGFPEALAALACGTSFRGVHFGSNFDAGAPWSAAEVERLVEKHSECTARELVRSYAKRFEDPDYPMFVDPKQGYQTVPPYPKFFTHFLQHVVVDRSLPYRYGNIDDPDAPDIHWDDDN
ncbi:hypothetical protein B0T21DRAFT_367183 [Apiosordaria backusii]|uniref:Uncharacterized protein n=1 Tax=Apiosordaria backusii TaxID=314023 RepID=A0AA40ECQ0_9PEZI|nr:hypothetical protein B0T21DRAFT_367183 [Apiosordaria backusii]